MRTQINAILRIDRAEAEAESPVLDKPLLDKRVTSWVGADERPEFVRQNRWLCDMWKSFGVEMD